MMSWERESSLGGMVENGLSYPSVIRQDSLQWEDAIKSSRLRSRHTAG